MSGEDIRGWGPASESMLAFAESVIANSPYEEPFATFYAGFLAFAALVVKAPDVGREFAAALMAETERGGGNFPLPPDSSVDTMRELTRTSAEYLAGAAR